MRSGNCLWNLFSTCTSWALKFFLQMDFSFNYYASHTVEPSFVKHQIKLESQCQMQVPSSRIILILTKDYE